MCDKLLEIRNTPTRRYWREIGGTLDRGVSGSPLYELGRVGLVPKRSHGWVVPDTVSPRAALVSPLYGRRGMDLANIRCVCFSRRILFSKPEVG